MDGTPGPSTTAWLPYASCKAFGSVPCRHIRVNRPNARQLTHLLSPVFPGQQSVILLEHACSAQGQVCLHAAVYSKEGTSGEPVPVIPGFRGQGLRFYETADAKRMPMSTKRTK